jgi:hypothetical protein
MRGFGPVGAATTVSFALSLSVVAVDSGAAGSCRGGSRLYV